MPELDSSGSVRGALRNERSYRERHRPKRAQTGDGFSSGRGARRRRPKMHIDPGQCEDRFHALTSLGVGLGKLVMPRRLAIALCAATVLIASSADSYGDLIYRRAWSYAFTDDAWVGGPPRGPQELLPQPLKSASPTLTPSLKCKSKGHPLLCKRLVRRDDRLSSTDDTSDNLYLDLTGHVTSLGGMIIAEGETGDDSTVMPVEFTQWLVVGEESFDQRGRHTWLLLSPGASPYARWLPIRVYRFAGVGPGLSPALAEHSRTTVPEPSTRALVVVGSVGLCLMSLARRERRRCSPVTPPT